MKKSYVLLAILWLAIKALPAAADPITTVAGIGISGYNGEKVPAAQAKLTSPYSVAVDGSGNIYIADIWGNRIQKVDASTGLISTAAGTGAGGYNGDGIPAVKANISAPLGVCLDSAGNLYFAEYSGSRVRRVDAKTGLISTVAGTGVNGYNGDGISATTAQLNVPHHVAIDRLGRIYIADRSNSRCRRVDTHGIIATVAGGGRGGGGGDGGPATLATMGWVEGVWVSPNFDIYLAISTAGNIRKVDGSTGIITTLTESVGYPLDVVGDCGGNLFVGTGQTNEVFRVNASTGETTPLTADGTFAKEGGSSGLARLAYPAGVGVDNQGNLLIGDNDGSKILLVKGVAKPCQGKGGANFIASQPSTLVPPTAAPTPGPIQVSPNPFNPNRALGGVLMAYQVPAGSTMSIFNGAGELVVGDLPEVSLSPGDSQAPQGVIAWNGLNANHEKIPAGSYYYAIQNGGKILRAGRVKLVWE